MRYCHFVSHTYSQIYDGRARARTADTHAHRTTRTRHNCRTKHEHICGNSAQKRHHQQMQHKILRQGLFLGPHSSKHSPHARAERAEDMPSTMPPRACEGGKGVRGGVRQRLAMRRADKRGMREGTTGLRGVASGGRGGHTCVAAGRWRVEDRPPRTPPESKCRKEAMSDEGVAVAPRPPQDAVL